MWHRKEGRRAAGCHGGRGGGKESESCQPRGCWVFHQGARLTSASCLDFLLCESCQSLQTDKQTDRRTDRGKDRRRDRWRDRQSGRQAGSQAGSPLSGAETPGAQWLPWIHSWSLCATLTLYVYCMHVSMHVRGLILESSQPGHYKKNNRAFYVSEGCFLLFTLVFFCFFVCFFCITVNQKTSLALNDKVNNLKLIRGTLLITVSEIYKVTIAQWIIIWLCSSS